MCYFRHYAQYLFVSIIYNHVFSNIILPLLIFVILLIIIITNFFSGKQITIKESNNYERKQVFNMQKLYYKPEDAFFGDCMPYGVGDKFYLFHQRDKRNPGPLPDCEPFGWDLVTTNDFVHYEYRGTSIECGAPEAQDQFIFAGSIFKSNDIYHALYTGYNRDYVNQGKASQVLMQAHSHDLIHWEKSKEFPAITPQEGYDSTDWRDPFVIWDDEKEEYLLILGTRRNGDKHLQSGCTVYFTSKDAINWQFQGDFWAPGLFTMHEMPDLFKIGNWWYLLTTEYSHRCKTIYRMSKSLSGPWLKPSDDAFDGRAYYAARSFQLNQKRILFGWVPTRATNNDKDDFVWGGIYMAHEIFQRKDGTLGVQIPSTVWGAFNNWETLPSSEIVTSHNQIHKVLKSNTSSLFAFQMDFTFSNETDQFGITLYDDVESGCHYQFTISLSENKMYFDKIPNWPWPAINNTGLERPLTLIPNHKYHLQLILDDIVATIYINGVALNAVMYEKCGNALGITVSNGILLAEKIRFSNSLEK